MSTIGDTPQYGVYSLGSYAKNYKTVLDFTHPISLTDLVSVDGFSTNNLEIGAITMCGKDLFVSWYDHDTATYGVDKIDYDYKLDQAYFVTPIISPVRERLESFIKFFVAYCNLPTSTDINIQYSTDWGVTWVSTTEIKDTARKLVTALETVEGAAIMIKVIFTSSANTAPTIESMGIEVL